MRNSAVPVFREIAKRVGIDQMRGWLARLDYGNKTVGKTISDFWLDGPLKISAFEQIRFLIGLHLQNAPASLEVQKQVIGLIPVHVSQIGILRGKTGWSTSPEPAIGWYIGWLETPRDNYIFALNMDMTEKSHRRARIEVVQDVLSAILEEKL